MIEPKLHPVATQRLLSLDAFRGFTIALMIVVNNPGSWAHVYAPLLHAEWHGLTSTDLVFPFFLFIVGVSIVLAYSKRLLAGADKKEIYRKIVIRSLKIFAIGLFLNLFPNFHFEEMRVAGVLQRIAIVFLVCSMLYLNTNWKTLTTIGAGILIFYYIIMVFVPVPGLGVPSLAAGKNIAAWIDGILLPGNMWQGTWDPEGLFSTLPAIATGIAGILAGVLMVSNKPIENKIILQFTLGFFTLVAGVVWSWFFPVNKNLWTSSYVLYTAGAASLTLAASIYVVDVLHIERWTRPGRILGANAITVYVISGILPGLYSLLFPSGKGLDAWLMEAMENIGFAPKFASLCYALLFMLVCYVPAYFLYKKKIFIKL
ncbi:MAG: DUF1624 domain-containing protein [Cyclobacteriaceae bacterium]|nr:DUF1624 domain-containing protein [Cyclobacteriaceae bacterium]